MIKPFNEKEALNELIEISTRVIENDAEAITLKSDLGLFLTKIDNAGFERGYETALNVQTPIL
jgi:hypothetical protein